MRAVKLKSLTAGLVLAASAALTQAQPMPMDQGGPEMMAAVQLAHALKAVGASEAQKTQIRQIMQAARQELQPTQQSLAELHQQGEALFTAATVDANLVEALRQKVQAQREVLSKRMSQALVDASRVLSPEQRAKLATLRKERGDGMRERLHERMGRRAPQAKS